MTRRFAVLSIALAALFACARPVAAQAPAASKTPPAAVNINTASADQLEALPGLGPRLAARIVEYRQKNGPFKRVEDVMNVRGIGEKNFVQIKPLMSVGPAKAEKAAADPAR